MTTTAVTLTRANTSLGVAVGATVTIVASATTGPIGATGATGATGAEGGTTTLTTKGDILTRDASALARQGVGTNGYFLKADSTQTTGLIWSVAGDALVANPLSQFASTTSAQLAGVISNETGTGALVFATSPALVTPTGIVKNDVGLGSVDNTADTAKPVSTAQQTALNLKADLASPTFTGTPTLPTGSIATTQTAADSSTKIATTAFVTTADNLKANLASPTFTGTPTLPTGTIATTQTASNNTTAIATTAYVDTADALKATIASTNTFTTNQIISGTTTADLLRITQLGTGNALIVEDSTNPDSTPFVVDGSGRVGIGMTAPGVSLQVQNTTQAAAYFDTASNNSAVDLRRNNGTFATPLTVASSNIVGTLDFSGHDGTSYNQLARVTGSVDGTVSTGIVPGRLLFSTENTSGTLTERMRIDSSGFVGVGTSAPTVRLDVSGSTTISSQNNVSGAFGTTTSGRLLLGSITGNTPFIGSEGATNLLFYTNAVERMRINSSGLVGIGVTPSGSMLHVVNTTAANKALLIKGAASQSGLLLDIQNSAATSLVTVDSAGNLGIGTATPFNSSGYGALTVEGTGGHIISGKIAGTETFRVQTTTLSTTINVIANVPFLFNTNNTERMRINADGNVGIGGAAGGDTNFGVLSNITGATTAYGVRSLQTIQSGVTATAHLISSQPSTAATAFTATKVNNFTAFGGTIGAGSAITTQAGYLASSSLTVATNNYGFQGSIASGTNRWNLYMDGTARNYLAGGLEVVAGTTAMTAGFTHIPAAAGVPSGAPTNPTGNVPMYYDTTNNRIYVYNGAWKMIALV